MKTTSDKNHHDGRGLAIDDFMDLCDYVWTYGTYVGPSPVADDDLKGLKVLNEPGERPDALKVFMRDGWPVAVCELKAGFTIIRCPS